MISEEIEKIEEEIRKTPYHKATQYHIGKLKAKLARLKELEEKICKKGARGVGYSIRKTGDATVLLVGFPSVGKSTLLNKITHAESKTADYDFTTLNIIPGMMKYKSANIQVLDIPGIIQDMSSKREVLSVIRNADLILIMVAAPKINKILKQLEILNKELYNAGFRLNKSKPDISIYPRTRGGIEIGSTVKLTKLDKATICSILNEFKIRNAEVLIKEDISLDQLIDSVMKNRVYVPSIIVLNKIDILNPKELKRICKKIDCIPISAIHGTNIDKLKELIWKKLKLMRIYMKKIGNPPDFKHPLIVPKYSNLEAVCIKIHKDFLKNFKYARIWGPSAKFQAQKIGLDHKLKDGDVVELHTD
jgi:hypothetical protein